MPIASDESTARGAAVHALLEWSQANGWTEPSEELALRHAEAAGLGVGSASPDDSGEGPRRHSPLPLDGLLEPVRRWIGSAAAGADNCRGDSRSGRGAVAARGRRGPSCAARSTSWSSGRGRRRWSSTTRPTGSRAPIRPSAPRTTRCSARSTRLPSPRRSMRPRSRSPTSSSSGRTSPPSPPLAPAEMTPPAQAWRKRSLRSAAASSRSPRPRNAIGPSAAAARPCEGFAPVLSQPTSGALSSFAARSSRRSSFSPSPTSSSSAAQ